MKGHHTINRRLEVLPYKNILSVFSFSKHSVILYFNSLHNKNSKSTFFPLLEHLKNFWHSNNYLRWQPQVISERKQFSKTKHQDIYTWQCWLERRLFAHIAYICSPPPLLSLPLASNIISSQKNFIESRNVIVINTFCTSPFTRRSPSMGTILQT